MIPVLVILTPIEASVLKQITDAYSGNTTPIEMQSGKKPTVGELCISAANKIEQAMISAIKIARGE